MDFDGAYSTVQSILRAVGRAVVGKGDLLRRILATFIAGGHVLIEGSPGTAKTLIAKSIARAIGGSFTRIQGNPDVLPTDLTGFYIYGLDGSKKFVKGPIFTNILMFDELNRTPPRVQSSLLQAMAEMQVSVDGVTHELPRPFHVIATEVPAAEERGVYPLTLTLLDRFWIRCTSFYNPLEEEIEIIRMSDRDRVYDVPYVETVVSLSNYIELQNFVLNGIYADDRVVRYIASIAGFVRSHRYVKLGPSHRGSIYLYRVAKALALIDKRDYVVPDDVKSIAVDVLAHRIILSEEAVVEGVKPEDVVREALNRVEVPKE